MRTETLAAGLLLTVVMGGGASAQTRSTNPEKGSEACAGCHAEIYKSYQKTVMAKASGMARDGLITGEFTHKTSGVHYKVYEQDGHAWMSYERPKEAGFRGKRELLYYIR
jgi:hypothetical protein